MYPKLLIQQMIECDLLSNVFFLPGNLKTNGYGISFKILRGFRIKNISILMTYWKEINQWAGFFNYYL